MLDIDIQGGHQNRIFEEEVNQSIICIRLRSMLDPRDSQHRSISYIVIYRFGKYICPKIVQDTLEVDTLDNKMNTTKEDITENKMDTPSEDTTENKEDNVSFL